MHLPFLFLLFTTTIASKQELYFAHCSQDLYHSASFYEFNLRVLLTNLTASTPKSPHLHSLHSNFGVYGFAQCRPDATQIECTDCLLDSSSKLATAGGGAHVACGQSISATLYQDLCLLRYSNWSFIFFKDKRLLGSIASFVTLSNPGDFGRRVVELMERISWEASTVMEKFAVGVAEAGDAQKQKIYGMVWCIWDLTSKDCLQCLLSGVPELPYTMKGGRLFYFACVLRFEVYMFFDLGLVKNKTSLESAAADGDVKNESVAAGGQGDSSLKS